MLEDLTSNCTDGKKINPCFLWTSMKYNPRWTPFKKSSLGALGKCENVNLELLSIWNSTKQIKAFPKWKRLKKAKTKERTLHIHSIRPANLGSMWHWQKQQLLYLPAHGNSITMPAQLMVSVRIASTSIPTRTHLTTETLSQGRGQEAQLNWECGDDSQ